MTFTSIGPLLRRVAWVLTGAWAAWAPAAHAQTFKDAGLEALYQADKTDELQRVDEAKAAFQRFVAAGKGQKRSLEDARKRQEQLGG